MAKRTVTRIGDIFCAEIDNEYKCYFQYVGKDTYQLGGALIRVFRKRYPLDANPSMDDITADEVAFYTLTYIQPGTYDNAWYKVGKAPIRNEEALKDIIFGNPREYMTDMATLDTYDVNPFEHWFVRYFNCYAVDLGVLPEKLKTLVEWDSVHPYSDVVDRMRYGYFKATGFFYTIVKRIPWPDVHSYTMSKNIENGDMHYYHFFGNVAVREVIVRPDGKIIRLIGSNPERDGYRLYSRDFGDINWHYLDFLTREEFESMWELGKIDQ